MSAIAVIYPEKPMFSSTPPTLQYGTVPPILIADSMGLDTENDKLFEMQKLHLSPCERVAFAYCGSYLFKDQINTVMDFVVQSVIYNETAEEPSELVLRFPKLAPCRHDIDSRTMLIMSKKATYSYNSRDTTLNRIEWDAFDGTHGMATVCAFHMMAQKTPTIDLETAINRLIGPVYGLVGIDSGMVRFGFDFVTQDLLKPIVKEC